MKGRKILGVMLLLISFALIGSGAFLMINGDRIRFVNAIKKYTKNIVEDVNDFKNVFVFDDYDASGVNSKINTVNNFDVIGEKFIISGDMYSKANSKKDFYYDVVIKRGRESVAFDLLLKDSKMYFKIKDALTKYYYIDFGLLDNVSDFTMDDLGVLKDYFLDATFKVLAKRKITTEKVDLSLSGTTYKLDKLTIDVDEETMAAITIAFMKKVDEDAKYRNLINSSTPDGTTLADSIKELEKKTDFSNKLVLKYSIYVDSKENIYRHEIADNENVAMIIDSYSDKEGKKHFLFDFVQDGTSMLSFAIDGIDASQSVITGKVYGEPVISGTYSRTDSKIALDLSFKANGEDIIKLAYAFECKEKSKKYTMSLKLELIDGVEKITLDSVNTIELGVEFPSIDVSGAGKIEEITESEYKKIESVVMKLFQDLDIFGEILDSM